MKIIEKIVDLENNSEEIIERDETESEKNHRLKLKLMEENFEIAKNKAAAAKAALLEKLGITEDEAKLLLS